MVKKKKRRIPKTWIVRDRGSHTISLRDRETGRMLGRRKIKKGEISDFTHVRRVREGKYSGMILGRTPSIKVRASSKRRGTLRRRL